MGFHYRLAVVGAFLPLFFTQAFASAPDLSGLSGGVVVQVGCGNGALLRQTGTNDAFFTIGLDTNTASVASLRQTLRDEGYSGQVLVDEWNGVDLPFINNFVNALVLSDTCNVSTAEAMRVLVPNGVVCRLQGTNWVTEVKLRPATMDEWTHGAHGPDNNPCSHDTEVGPLRQMQWYTGPAWQKYHFSSPSVSFILAGGGRLFYVVDDSPTSVLGGGFPERWTLIVRDAFNGKLLWSKPMSSQWGMATYAYYNFWNGEVADLGPLQGFERRFVVDGNRLYGTMGWSDPVIAMDAATGSNIWTSVGTGDCRELYAANGRLYLRCATDPELIVLDADTGETLWTDSSYNPTFIAVRDDQLCLRNSSGVVALNATNYVQQWVSSSNPGTPSGYQPWLIQGGSVVIARKGNGDTGTWYVYSAATGQELWTHAIPAVNISSANNRINQHNLFVSNNRVWTYTSDTEFAGLNLLTGAKEIPVNVKNVTYSSHHHRCIFDVATDRYFINSQQDLELIELSSTGTNQIHNWVRASCHAGVVPANGLIYVPPASCTCQDNAMIHGFYTLAAARPPAGRVFTADNRLTTGAAFGQVSGYAPATNDWAQYRYDPKRKSATSVFVPKILQPMWSTSLGNELTPPVVADGRLFVVNRTDHMMCALDAATGGVLWNYATGGDVDSPPSVWGDCVIFGCDDGRVYCLRAADGALVWRFQAAPRDCRNMQLDNVSSVWPVSGSVLVDRGSVFVTAGHSSRLDGGIWLYKLDALSGAVLATNQVMHVSPDVPADTNQTADREGLKNDLMVSDGVQLFLREAVYTSNLVATTSSRTDHMSSKANRFLDSSWNHRQCWDYNTIFAQYLCVDNQKVYGIKAFTAFSRFDPLWARYQPGSGYILFAQNISTKGATPIVEPEVENETRPQPVTQHLWWKRIPLRIQAMVRAGDYLFVAGPPDVFNRADPFAAFEGRAGGSLWTVSPTNGERLAECALTSPPVYDGMAAANNCLFMSTVDGNVICFGQPETAPAASASVQPSKGTTSTVFTFDGTGSQDLDGQIVSYEWRVNGAVVSTNAIYTTSFGTTGGRTVQLTVRDNDGMKGSDTEALSVTSSATDTDSDGLPDTWEITWAGNLTAMNTTGDKDGDGLSDLQEYVYGTDPSSNDTDGDGLQDSQELIAGTSPVNADSLLRVDGERLSNGQMRLAWDSASNRIYSVWGTSNLVSGMNELVAYQIEATPPVNTFTEPADRHVGSYFYRVQVSQNTPVPPPNAAPSVRDDGAYTTTNKAVAVNVLFNDSDPDFQSLAVTGVTQGAHGAVSFTSTNVTYTPQSGWTGGTDTFTYTVRDSLGATASGQVTVYVSSGSNLVVDPFLQKAHLEIATITGTQAGAGWYIGTKRTWWWDRDNEWSFAFCSGAEAAHRALAQVIYDNKAAKGAGVIRFDATHQGTGNTLKVKVYGAGSFSQSMGSETGSGTLLYDSGNIATTEFDWTGFSGTVNFGTGYSYYLVLVWTDGIVPGTGEFMAVDNFYLGAP